MANAVEFEIKITNAGGDVIKAITVEATNADEAIKKIVASASRAGKSLHEMAEKALVMDTSVRALQNLQQMVSGLAAPYNSFETAMRSANTMAGKSGEEYEELSDKIVSLSKSIPMAREELANGLYQVISNGVPEDNWLDFLEQSSKASIGGIADLGQTVTVTSTLIKNYGLEWSAAGEIQDKIQMTAKNGVTSFEQLAQALPRVSGSAAQLGVSMDELMAVFATTTGVTGNTSEVSTQLAAVLNSLIKPSSEAQAAAAAMGISFDAASVQACGGFSNFLTQLDSSVQAYAAQSGQLSQTIYGQLFGSAEALRLLGSLTGEQKDKFVENIGAMCDSAGSVSGSYDNMSSTGESFNQVIQNQIQSFMDWGGAVASTSAPIIALLANVGTCMLNMKQMATLLGILILKIKAWNVATLAANAAQKVVAVTTRVWSAVQAALNVVLSANPIGIIIMAIAALIGLIIAAYNSNEDFRKILDAVWAAIKKVASVIWSALVKAFNAVTGVIKKAWEWIKRFFGITDENSAKKTSEELNKQKKSTEELAKANKNAAGASGLAAKEANWQTMSYKNLGEAIENKKKQIQELAGVNDAKAAKEAATLKQMEARYKKLGKQYGLSSGGNNNEFDGKSLIQNAQSYKELGNNITYYQNKLEKTKPSETAEIARLSKLIQETTKAQDAIKKLQESYSQPASLNTISDIDKAISYQKSLLESASASEMAQIKKNISQLESQKQALEDAGHVEIDVDQIKTYDQLSDELSYYQDKLNRATEEERAQIVIRIEALNKLKKKWDETADALKVPGDITKLNTINQLSDAFSYYQNRMKNASASEIANIQETIKSLEDKKNALQRISDISNITAETDRLQGLSGKKLKMELELIGLNGVKTQIQSLQAMLDDTKNPLGDDDRNKVERSIATWKKYGKQMKMNNLTVNDVWGSVKGAGSSIQNMSAAIKSDGNAWEKTTSIVDGALGIYDSFSKVASVIKTVTDAISLSKKGEAVATTISTTATEEGAVTSTAAAGEEAAASSVVTTAKIAEAGAKTFAAHASIPWVGIAIAGGLIATMTGIMLALPKFANGGIAYGPTLGIFGEYAGAANNPEVVAPLNKLKSLIEPQGALGGEIKLRIEGRDIVGVINKENLIRRRTR